MSQAGGWYDATYGRFALDARARVRQETYGEDIGSNGWMNANELCLFIHWLGVGRGLASPRRGLWVGRTQPLHRAKHGRSRHRCRRQRGRDRNRQHERS